MPVALLFCEGGGSSPDAILLNHVLAGTGCEIRPGGGKHELSKRIMATRAKGLRSAGIRDRDFDDEESSESLSLFCRQRHPLHNGTRIDKYGFHFTIGFSQ